MLLITWHIFIRERAYLITRILSDTLINANLGYFLLVYLALTNVPFKFFQR